MIKVKRKLSGAGVQRRANRPESKPPVAVVPRISKLMALAIHFDRLLRDGEVSGVKGLARLCHVTQPRISQILALNMLAPKIQEELLLLPAVTCGRPVIQERMLRPIAAEVDWGRQQAMRGDISTFRIASRNIEGKIEIRGKPRQKKFESGPVELRKWQK